MLSHTWHNKSHWSSHNPFISDPYLDFQPSFAYSLPVQILCNGVILTLTTVLLIHLLLTVQFHWALARLNYVLQLSAVITLLFEVSASTYVIFISVLSYSRDWPYMLDYIAVEFPMDTWSTTEQALWLALEATTSGLAHITHIQFLTLMYPSRLEARLIFIFMGPLAIASSAMQFTSLSQYERAIDLGDAIRGVCNATLALLFSFALFIWGFFLNRSRAWRTDGGTAAFGAAACFLAVMSVVINFCLVFVDSLRWLPTFSWAVVLWQTFLGWWWWVGAGMGIGEVEDMLYLEQQRKEARLRKKAKAAKKERDNDARRSGRAKTGFLSGAATARGPRTGGGASSGTGTGSASASGSTTLASWFSERRGGTTRRRAGGEATGTVEEFEMTTANSQIESPELGREGIDHPRSTPTPTPSSDQQSLTGFLYHVPILGPWLGNLASAHRRAAIEVARGRQAENEQSRRRRRRGRGRGRAGREDEGEIGGEGWGLGSHGLREREEAEKRIRDFQNERRRRMLIGSTQSVDRADGEGEDDYREHAQGGEHEGRAEGEGEGASSGYEDVESGEEEDGGQMGGRLGRYPPYPRHSQTASSALPPSLLRNYPDGVGSPDDARGRPPANALQPDLPEPLPPAGSLFWRWGPLRKWRLQDRTVY